jgi:hypothetical protein
VQPGGDRCLHLPTDGPLIPSAAITKGEQVLWHDQYIKSAAELCQWEAVAECVSCKRQTAVKLSSHQHSSHD